MTQEFEFTSTMLDSPASWDPDEEGGLLTLTFRGSGKTFAYTDVPQSVWEAFKAAPSQGKFFHSNLKARYPFREV